MRTSRTQPPTAPWDKAATRSLMTRGWQTHDAKGGELVAGDPREETVLTHLRVVTVFKQDGSGHIVFQILGLERESSRGEPMPPHPLPRTLSEHSGRGFLAELIEAHFGSTEHFQADYVKELDSWAVRARGLSLRQVYDKTFHVDNFIQLVDDTLDELRG